jgi:steroid delta-isomerase-like uncharacterized protein
MATNENIAQVKQVYDCFNRRDWDGAQKLVRKEVEWNNVPAGMKFTGPDGVIQFMKGWVDAFPDGKVEVVRVLSANDFALAECRFTGTQQGELRTPYGNMPPSGRQAEMNFCEVFEFKNGKILRSHTYPDNLSLLRAIGAVEGRAAGEYTGAHAM